MRILTGIKPTGDVHLGNYIGAIKPIIELAKTADEVFVFVADYHALNNKVAPEVLRNYNKEMMIVLHCFLGHLDNVFIYFQSQVAEIFEIDVILSNYAAKGLLNRAHAYKAKVDLNVSYKKEQDFEVNMGLFNYPILMSADILTFNPDFVPVGFDQRQHLEITRDIAKVFNKQHGDIFTVAEPYIQSQESLLGLDGRKMSKSYNNTIALFLKPDLILKRFKKIKSDSTTIGEPISYKDDTLYNIMSSFLLKEQLDDLIKMYKNGEKRVDIKIYCFDLFMDYFGPYMDKYEEIKNDFNSIESKINTDLLHVRSVAKDNLDHVKDTIGINI